MEKSVKTFHCVKESPEEYKCTDCRFATNIKAIMSLHITVRHKKRPNNVVLGFPLIPQKCRVCDFQTYSLLCLTKHVYSFNHMTKFRLESENLRLHFLKRHKRREVKPELNSLRTKCKAKPRREIKPELSFSKSKRKAKPQGIFDWKPFHCMRKSLLTYRCEDCGFKTYLKTKMSFHKQSIDLSKRPVKYKCGNCKFQTYSLLMLTKHVYNWNHVANDGRGLYAFKTEDNNFLKPPCRLEKKAILPIPGKPKSMRYKCHYCLFESNDKCTLHKWATHPEEKKIKYKCELCSYEAFQKPDLNDHIMAKHTDAENMTWFECSHCPLKSKRKKHLKNRIVTIHENEDESNHYCKYTDAENINWFECVQCLYKTKEKTALKKHILTHTNEEASDWFQCDKCAFKFKVKTFLKLHALKEHENTVKCESGVQYQCEQCPYKAAKKFTLKNHVIPEHTRWFTCEECPFKTSRKDSLKGHILTKHFKEGEISWFKCEFCTYRAKVKALLKRHVIKKHGDFLKC